MLLGTLLVASSLTGCTSATAGPDEPPPAQVRRELARLLSESEHLRVTEFRQEAPGKYTAVAVSPGGVTYQVAASTEGRVLVYRAEGGDRFLRGRANLPEAPFDELHPQAMQWLRIGAILVQGAGVVWPALGMFGLRRRYSRRVETMLALVAAINAGCVVWWAMQLANNWGAG
jgi:hypothetical protein